MPTKGVPLVGTKKGGPKGSKRAILGVSGGSGRVRGGFDMIWRAFFPKLEGFGPIGAHLGSLWALLGPVCDFGLFISVRAPNDPS